MSGSPASSDPTTVLIADDQQLVRTGLRMILEAADGLRVVGEAVNGTEAVAQTTRLRPDGVLMDVQIPGQLVGAIRAIARGEELFAPELTRRLIEQFVTAGRRPRSAGLDRLTARELEVLTLVARGLSNAEIAHQLILGVDTVKTHVSRVLDKLALRDRVQAVILAYESGIVRPPAADSR